MVVGESIFQTAYDLVLAGLKQRDRRRKADDQDHQAPDVCSYLVVREHVLLLDFVIGIQESQLLNNTYERRKIAFARGHEVFGLQSLEDFSAGALLRDEI